MTVAVVEEMRERLGRVGAVLMTPIAPADEWRHAARRVEQAGYGSLWTKTSATWYFRRALGLHRSWQRLSSEQQSEQIGAA